MSDPLRVLVLSDDADLIRVVVASLADADVEVNFASGASGATEALHSGTFGLAFIDGRKPGTLAFVQHVRALVDGVHVVVAIDPADADTVRAALDLGADALITTPVTGDAAFRAMGRARAESAIGERMATLERRIEAARASSSLLRRVVEAALEGDSELVDAALDVIAELAPSVRASVSLFQPDDPPISTMVAGETRRLVLGEEGREVGVIEMTGGDDAGRAVALELAGVLSSLLILRARSGGAIGDGSSRTLDRRVFDDVLTRELEKARRHHRALSLLCVDAASVDLGALASHLRTTDVIGRGDPDVFVLLPETSAVGAVRLRRRIGRWPVGVATALRDGFTRDALVASARAARERTRRSPLAPLMDVPLALSDLVRDLLSRPLQDTGALTLYPLVLSVQAAASLVMHACYEGARDGEAYVHLCAEGPIAAAVRAVASELDGSLVVLEHAPAPLSATTAGSAFAVVLTSEHGSWACAGRTDEETTSAVHGADPLLADRLVASLEGA